MCERDASGKLECRLRQLCQGSCQRSARACRAADVIGFQEAKYDRKNIARGLGRGWALNAGKNALPIAWRTSKFRLVAQGRDPVYGHRMRVEGGADGKSSPPKHITWVRLKEVRSPGRRAGAAQQPPAPQFGKGWKVSSEQAEACGRIQNASDQAHEAGR